MKIIKNWHLDVIHSQTEFGIGYFSRIVAKKLNLPIVHTYHTLYEDYVHYVTHGHFNNLAKKLAIKITKYYCEKKCDELIVPTDKIKDLFINKYNISQPINVIPTGIDIDKFKLTQNIKKEIENIKKKYNPVLKKFYNLINTSKNNLWNLSYSFYERTNEYRISISILGKNSVIYLPTNLDYEENLENNVRTILTEKMNYLIFSLTYDDDFLCFKSNVRIMED